MSKGMAGFDGDGELALGTVKGYRLFKLRPAPAPRYYRKPKMSDVIHSFNPDPMIPFDPTYDEIALRALEGAKRYQWPEHCGKEPIKAHCATMQNYEFRTRQYPEAVQYANSGLMGVEFHDPSEVPYEKCGCGFYAYWDSGLSTGALLGKVTQTPFVIGVMEGHGSVLIGEKGFRSEFAKLLGVAVIPEYYGYERVTIEEQAVAEDRYNPAWTYQPAPGTRGVFSYYEEGAYYLCVKSFDAPTYQDIREELSIGYPGVYVAKDLKDLITKFGYEEEYRQFPELRNLYYDDIVTPGF
jgi:hypothetical protein